MSASKAMSRSRGAEKGITLIESLMVLGISAAFVAGGVALYSQANTSNQARATLSDVYAIIAAVRPLDDYSDIGDGSGVPATGKQGTHYGVGKPSWGGDYDIKSTTDGSIFTIIFSGVPETACNTIQSSLTGLGSAVRVEVDKGASPALAHKAAGTALNDAFILTAVVADKACGDRTRIGVGVE